MSEDQFRWNTRTHSSHYGTLEESSEQRVGYDFDLSCPNPREYSESFSGRNLDPRNSEFVNSSVTTTEVSFRAAFDRWAGVIRDSPGVLNGVTIDRGQIALVPPGLEVEGTYDAGFEYGIITTGQRLAAVFDGKLPREVVAVRADPAKLASLASAIRTELDGDPVEGGVVAPCLEMFDVRAERLLTRAREHLALRIRDLIDARLASDLCLATLCSEVGVSLRTAERAFSLRFQETMIAYLQRARLERARELLAEGKLVKQAAMEVGWNHLGRFSIEFRRRFGVSPSMVRPSAGAPA